MSIVSGKAGKIYLKIQVKTNAPRFKIEYYDDAIDIYVKSLPKKGKANKEIINEIAKLLEIPSTSIEVIRGHKSSTKVLQINNIPLKKIKNILIKFQPTQKKQ